MKSCSLLLCLLYAISVNAQPSDPPSTHVLDISFACGASLGPAARDYEKFLQRLTPGSLPVEMNDFERIPGAGAYLAAQYFITPRFAPGVALGTLGGFMGIPVKVSGVTRSNSGKMESTIHEEHHSVGLYATATCLLWAPVFGKLPTAVKFTTGVGVNRVSSSHSACVSIYNPATQFFLSAVDAWTKSEASFSALCATSVEARVSKSFSIGVNGVFRYVPYSAFDARLISVRLTDGTVIGTYSQPACDLDFSDWNIGICTTLHLF